jgi:hypothetical protein
MTREHLLQWSETIEVPTPEEMALFDAPLIAEVDLQPR